MKAAACLLMVFAGIGATAAVAGTGSLIPGRSSGMIEGAGSDPYGEALAKLSDEQALATARRLASCLARDDPKRAGSFVLATGDALPAAERLVHHQLQICLEGQMMESTRVHFDTPELQGFVAEALLRRSPPPPQLFMAGSGTGGGAAAVDGPGLVGRAALDHTASCVARDDPMQVMPLVLAPARSPDEAKALSAVVPLLKSCIGPHEAFRANQNAVRLALAKALFRRANATAADPTGNR